MSVAATRTLPALSCSPSTTELSTGWAHSLWLATFSSGSTLRNFEPRPLPDPQERLLPDTVQTHVVADLGEVADPRLTKLGDVRPFDHTPPAARHPSTPKLVLVHGAWHRSWVGDRVVQQLAGWPVELIERASSTPGLLWYTG